MFLSAGSLCRQKSTCACTICFHTPAADIFLIYCTTTDSCSCGMLLQSQLVCRTPAEPSPPQSLCCGTHQGPYQVWMPLHRSIAVCKCVCAAGQVSCRCNRTLRAGVMPFCWQVLPPHCLSWANLTPAMVLGWKNAAVTWMVHTRRASRCYGSNLGQSTAIHTCAEHLKF